MYTTSIYIYSTGDVPFPKPYQQTPHKFSDRKSKYSGQQWSVLLRGVGVECFLDVPGVDLNPLIRTPSIPILTETITRLRVAWAPGSTVRVGSCCLLRCRRTPCITTIVVTRTLIINNIIPQPRSSRCCIHHFLSAVSPSEFKKVFFLENKGVFLLCLIPGLATTAATTMALVLPIIDTVELFYFTGMWKLVALASTRFLRCLLIRRTSNKQTKRAPHGLDGP